MSWLRFQTRSGILKIKPRGHLRHEERTRRVPMLDLGVVVISWWPTPQPESSPSRPLLAKRPNIVSLHLAEKSRRQAGARRMA